MDISAAVTQDNTLSWGAKGLLCYLLSTSEGLDVNQLVATFKEGRDATYRLVNELKAAGYVEEYTIRDKGRVLKRGYTVHAVPVQSQNSSQLLETSPDPEKPDQVKSDRVMPDQENLVPGKPDQDFSQPIKIKTFKKQNQRQNVKEKAAAKVFNTNLTNSTSQFKKPAAAFLSQLPALQTDDLIITDTLTTNQIAMVKARIFALTVSYYAPDRLLDEVIITLLQPKSFSNAGTDFLKKLNTIIKTINDQRWTPPSAPKVHQIEARQQAPSHDHTLQSLYVQRSCLISTVNAFTDQMHFHRTRNNLTIANGMQSQVDDAKAQLVILNAKIVEFESVPPIAAVN